MAQDMVVIVKNIRFNLSSSFLECKLFLSILFSNTHTQFIRNVYAECY
jgi:hypothetical protein